MRFRRPGSPHRALRDARHAAAGADGPPPNALSYPNYRRFWFGAVVRVFGFQFQLIGAGWLVAAELGRSPFWLGVVWLANALPTILLPSRAARSPTAATPTGWWWRASS